jgi:hypothetical protein
MNLGRVVLQVPVHRARRSPGTETASAAACRDWRAGKAARPNHAPQAFDLVDDPSLESS